jgi:hypothetical protein
MPIFWHKKTFYSVISHYIIIYIVQKLQPSELLGDRWQDVFMSLILSYNKLIQNNLYMPYLVHSMESVNILSFVDIFISTTAGSLSTPMII